MSTSAQLRAALADALTEDGTLADPAWRSAVETVPRELFAPGYFEQVPDSAPTRYRPVREGETGWLEGIYTDRTLITQLDGRTRPDDVATGTVVGSPSSSSTLPSLVLSMWHRLDAQAGQRVLEVGTGTGYSTALGADRLGNAGLTSIEYDPVVGAAAAAAVRSAGYAPRLIIGDGLRGDPEGGAYDRLIATCSVRYLPMAWLHQVRPGGRILVTLSGWSYASGLALLTVTGPGTATGRFRRRAVRWLPSRPVRPVRAGFRRWAGSVRSLLEAGLEQDPPGGGVVAGSGDLAGVGVPDRHERRGCALCWRRRLMDGRGPRDAEDAGRRQGCERFHAAVGQVLVDPGQGVHERVRGDGVRVGVSLVEVGVDRGTGTGDKPLGGVEQAAVLQEVFQELVELIGVDCGEVAGEFVQCRSAGLDVGDGVERMRGQDFSVMFGSGPGGLGRPVPAVVRGAEPGCPVGPVVPAAARSGIAARPAAAGGGEGLRGDGGDYRDLPVGGVQA